MKKHYAVSAVLGLTLAGGALVQAATPDPLIERGNYLARVMGCNDCHTAGYAPSGGKIPEADMLLGDSIGFRGPWGTTYPANLRLLVKDMTEEQWLSYAHNLQTRPPMPWFNVQIMNNEDLQALYRYLVHLGPAGEPAPAYVPPDAEPSTPYFLFVPQVGPLPAAAAQ